MGSVSGYTPIQICCHQISSQITAIAGLAVEVSLQTSLHVTHKLLVLNNKHQLSGGSKTTVQKANNKQIGK